MLCLTLQTLTPRENVIEICQQPCKIKIKIKREREKREAYFIKALPNIASNSGSGCPSSTIGKS